MLRYIELLSQHRTPSCAQWKAAPTKRQRDYNELKFRAVSIDEKRGAMCREIRAFGMSSHAKFGHVFQVLIKLYDQKYICGYRRVLWSPMTV